MDSSYKQKAIDILMSTFTDMNHELGSAAVYNIIISVITSYN